MRRAKLTEYETHSGALVDLLDPQDADVSLVDVAVSLAKTNRFNGAGKGHYSTAQHSCLVASLLPVQHRIHGLLHDAPEWVLGDMGSPVKTTLRLQSDDFRDAWDHIEDLLFAAVYRAANVDQPTDDVRALVKRADLMVLAAEQRDVMKSPNLWNLPYPAPDNMRITPFSAGTALAEYVADLRECGVEIGPLPIFI
jgi:hypothetical protein